MSGHGHWLPWEHIQHHQVTPRKIHFFKKGPKQILLTFIWDKINFLLLSQLLLFIFCVKYLLGCKMRPLRQCAWLAVDSFVVVHLVCFLLLLLARAKMWSTQQPFIIQTAKLHQYHFRSDHPMYLNLTGWLICKTNFTRWIYQLSTFIQIGNLKACIVF